METTKREREQGSGRYSYEGRWERLCVCGHALGHHTAARVVHKGKAYQNCIEADFAPMDSPCACECFKPAERGKP